MTYYKVHVSQHTFTPSEGFFVSEDVGSGVEVEGRQMVSYCGSQIITSTRGWHADRNEAYDEAIRELESRIATLRSQIAALQAKQSVEVAA